MGPGASYESQVLPLSSGPHVQPSDSDSSNNNVRSYHYLSIYYLPDPHHIFFIDFSNHMIMGPLTTFILQKEKWRHS